MEIGKSPELPEMKNNEKCFKKIKIQNGVFLFQHLAMLPSLGRSLDCARSSWNYWQQYSVRTPKAPKFEILIIEVLIFD